MASTPSLRIFSPSAQEYAAFYGLDVARLQRMRPAAIVLHPGSVNRGVELSPEVADSPRAALLDQVRNGLAVRMALLYLLFGGEDGSADVAS